MITEEQAVFQDSFEQEIHFALQCAAQLAREEAIRTNTGIVIEQEGKIIEISAAELKKQAKYNQTAE
ncbi:hypothetical protein [Candidatus Nitrosacidococcus sp. I8]|uniref:hypothetical protein n=1 Tax=Candidatus Nitrosacidococcus sp. I8 TaxID=2942908 RepID=UPI002226DC00|nr:hypothetical protein [Candidatus Nitrosacidococcus sp. I8]CAH9018291.1 hypothetical protein NURINAE_00840 [Candidatus Nitrosacidococcus sp. I8]